jgi:hypothetical protein
MRGRRERPGWLVWCAGLPLLATGAGCSAFSPQVGPDQESCGEDAAVAAPAGQTGYGPAPTVAPTNVSPRCSPDGGEACDDCESQFCCATRLACYADPVCACADRAWDRCTDDATRSASQKAACWAAFTSEGTVEAARVACERTWCQAVCNVP